MLDTQFAFGWSAEADVWECCRHCMKTKKLMFHNPEILHAFLSHLADQLVLYCSYQIKSGAQVTTAFSYHLPPGSSA